MDAKQKENNAVKTPFFIYEVLGSWKRHVEDNRFLSYQRLALDLVQETGFSHVEFYAYNGISL
jgi:1,4-alpha-glucan branching enzyme